MPYVYAEAGTGEPIEEQDLVEFRLLYEGEIPSTGNTNKPTVVHAIRRVFHPQLRRLWNAEKNLRELAMVLCDRELTRTWENPTREDWFKCGIETIGRKWNRVGFDWVPLVTPELALRCSIEVLLLRPELEEKIVMRRGDIDGQIKTLFDALRIPASAQETGSSVPQKDEAPFFVLLEDDRLITDLRVTTDRLLLLPQQTGVKPNDCHAVIHIKLNSKSAGTFDNYFG